MVLLKCKRELCPFITSKRLGSVQELHLVTSYYYVLCDDVSFHTLLSTVPFISVVYANYMIHDAVHFRLVVYDTKVLLHSS